MTQPNTPDRQPGIDWENVNPEHFFDFEARQAHQQLVEDLETYHQAQPSVDGKGKLHNPDNGQFINADEYYDDRRRAHKQEGLEATSYEDLSMTELARKMGEAELAGDKTTAYDVFDVLWEKIDSHVEKAKSTHGKTSEDEEVDLHAVWLDRLDKVKEDHIASMVEQKRKAEALSGKEITIGDTQAIEANFGDWFDAELGEEPSPNYSEGEVRELELQPDGTVIAKNVEIPPSPLNEELEEELERRDAKDVATEEAKNREKLGRMALALDDQEQPVENRIDEALSAWDHEQSGNEPDSEVGQPPRSSIFTDDNENSEEVTSHSNWLTTTVTDTANYVARTTRKTLRSVKSLAAKVFDQELVRNHDNDGREIDPLYRENQEKVRQFFIEKIESGEMYGDPNDPHGHESFVEILKQAHKLAAFGNIYNKVGKGKRLHPDQHGEIRTKSLINRRYSEAKNASRLAQEYGDPYSERLSTFGVRMIPNLYRVPEAGQPSDVLGNSGNYLFSYPDPSYLEQYFIMANALGREIADNLDDYYPRDELIDSIGRQYQYLACARPFYQINNSLFMNLVNTQLKMAGLEGVPHGELDTVAQRLQPDNFARYFKDYVMSKQPQK